MNTEIAKYSNSNKDNFIESIQANWLSEFTSPSTFKNFFEENAIPNQGKSLFNHIDYENMSGISNPNLTKAEDALEMILYIKNLYESPKFDFFKLINRTTGKPLNKTRVFIDDKLVNIPLDYYHGYTIEDFYKMKNLEFDPNNIVVTEVIDNYTNNRHQMIPGQKIRLNFCKFNQYSAHKQEIDDTIEFLKKAKEKGNYVQLMST